MSSAEGDQLYILLISIHGLIRGHNMELGRDADTGGQIKYVVELAGALARQPSVGQVDLLTRRVIDPRVDPHYGEDYEPLGDGATIVRLSCGPRRYLRKETLWPHLDTFVDHTLQHLRRVGRFPDLIHSHYADAAYVAARVAALLGVPHVHTGHSLGRDKRRRLLERGARESTLEGTYAMSRRIEAEEAALDSAALVVASTRQEIESQYAQYDNYHPRRMVIIPPGVDLSLFSPPPRSGFSPPITSEVDRFLKNPSRPLILALSRADERKNIATLVRAFGEHPTLRHQANLAVIAGNRDDISQMDGGARRVLSELLMLIDRYDLYGSVAYPKHHSADDVPDLYRLAAKRRGLFVNPALIEPFGLTLLEAAASGLPVLATNDGGPRDILSNCRNGRLIDPLDPTALGDQLADGLADRARWRRWARNGLNGVRRHYSWDAHAARYLDAIHRSLEVARRRQAVAADSRRWRLPTLDRMLICNIDETLLGDVESLVELLEKIRQAGSNIGFGVATGRGVESAMSMLRDWDVPAPDLLISGVGTEIRYGRNCSLDQRWQRHIAYRWRPEELREAMAGLRGVTPQPQSEQNPFKISFFIDEKRGPSRREIARHLRKQDLHANVIVAYKHYLDLLPIRASKGLALRYLAMQWGIPPCRLLVAADSGNDAEMLSGNVLGVVVGNHAVELEKLRGQARIYFARGNYARGILEGIEYYDFFGTLRIPATDQNLEEGGAASCSV